SRLGWILTMIGVAVGLGNVWRFPYMLGAYGGGAFLVLYLVFVLGIGVPALLCEWGLGRSTRRGTVGAFQLAGLPQGRLVGWLFFGVVACATGYYTNVVGWVVWYAAAEVLRTAGVMFDPSVALPPAEGFSGPSFGMQLATTGLVIGVCAAVLLKGVRKGTERISTIVMPTLLIILLILIVRAVTLPGAGAGVAWMLSVDPAAITPDVVLAALGQAVFSLSLGGTFMVVYGSYLADDEPLLPGALATALGDVSAGVLAGLAIFPAVFALGFEPASGPALLFETVPALFAEMPGGALFGLLFFCGLGAAALLSDVAAFEVLVAGLTDSSGLSRRRAVQALAVVVFLLAIPPMINMRVFVPWDLTFGSGMQTLGALAVVVTVGWSLSRAASLEALGLASGETNGAALLYLWIRWVVPIAVGSVGVWWVVSTLLPAIG
ncbi:MAG: NSS family neurotransmitter:Na+ symporter, partial [Myxococcota bacterium]